jgi:hypothetical protein
MKRAAISGDCNIISIMLLKQDCTYNNPNFTNIV